MVTICLGDTNISSCILLFIDIDVCWVNCFLSLFAFPDMNNQHVVRKSVGVAGYLLGEKLMYLVIICLSKKSVSTLMLLVVEPSRNIVSEWASLTELEKVLNWWPSGEKMPTPPFVTTTDYTLPLIFFAPVTVTPFRPSTQIM